MVSEPSEIGHKRAIALIVEREFGERPEHVRRMTAGSANEVYAVRVADRDLIVRLNEDPDCMRGAERHIALFRSLGISVPQIVAADASKLLVPYAYQVQTKLDGCDLEEVIKSLSEAQLKAIACEIAAISRKLRPLPTNGRFGWFGGAKQAAFPTWLDLLHDMRTQIAKRSRSTGAISDRHLLTFDALLDRHSGYFAQVRSTFYFDDMSSKNVIIHDGAFVGLVDLDTVAFGDPLEGVGRIEASWFGTSYGRIYANAVMDELELCPEERSMVSVYAILNRIGWLSEHGIKRNGNTSSVVDRDAVSRDEQVINRMLAEAGH